tara:strand:- start:3114 stop:3566 length:453 start_codon:yes stop_codon:yes gene_type:complete
MTQVSAAFTRDANAVPITAVGLTATKSITYAAGTTGATGATTLFTVTGVVALRVFALCGLDLTSGGAATMEVGVAGGTATLIAQTTATAIDVGEIWIDTAPALVELLPAFSLISELDVIQTIATTTVTGGSLTYYCIWIPISDTGNVVAA